MSKNINERSEACTSELNSLKIATSHIKNRNFYIRGQLNIIDTENEIRKLLPVAIDTLCVDFIQDFFSKEEAWRTDSGYRFYISAISIDVQFSIEKSGKLVNITAYGK